MMESFWINMGVAAMMNVIKNPEKRIKMKSIFLNLFLAIKSAYITDPDFQ